MPNLVSTVLVSASTAITPTKAVEVSPGDDIVAVEINVTAIGATPTATYQVEGSQDGVNYYAVDTYDSQDLSSAATALTRTYTAVGRTMLFATQDNKFWRYYRVNVTADLNVTHTITLYQLDRF